MSKCSAIKADGDDCTNDKVRGDAGYVEVGDRKQAVCGPHRDKFNRDGTLEFQKPGKMINPGEQMELVDNEVVTEAISQAREAIAMPDELHIAGTGHRPSGIKDLKAVQGHTLRYLDFMRMENHNFEVVVRAGGADGFDRVLARAAVMLDLKLVLYVPRGYFEHYHRGEFELDNGTDKPEMVQEWVFNMVNAASEVIWTQDHCDRKDLEKDADEHGFNWRYNFERNAQMMMGADHFVVCSNVELPRLLKATKGGTAHGLKEVVKNLKPNSTVMRIFANRDFAAWVNTDSIS